MRFDFIEIGTSDFDTLLETSNNKIGMSIEPLKFYLDSLPNNDKVIKVNCAISDTDFETDIFWISPDDIKKYDLPNWLRGCNSIINPHPSTIIELEKRNLLEIYKKSKCKCITWATLVSVYDITSVERLKIDTEGHDCKIVQSILSSNITLPNEILFENNVLTNEDDLNKTMSLLHEKGYYEVERSDYDILVKKLNKIGIDKVIFAVDDNPLYADFWPIQAKLVKEILKSEPVLFHITDNDSDFFDDGNGIVKRINKSNCPDIESSFQSQVIRMYGTKYFPEETCLTADIDMLMIDSDYFLEQIKEISRDDLVIYDSIAYDLERSECQNHNESCKDRYPICYILAKGKTLNKILNTNRSFEDYVDELQKLNLGWGTDELYFGDKVNNTNHGVNVVKLVRKYTTPWKAEKRIDRHNFPVILKHKGEIEAQKRDGIYDLDKLTFGHYIDVHCPRPYIEYKEEIDKLVEIIKKDKNMKKEEKIKELLLMPRMFYADYDTRYNQLKGLKMLIDECITENFVMVEIGSFAGVSSELFAIHCKELYCVDLWDPYWEITDKQRIEFAEFSFDKMIQNYKNVYKVKKSSVEASKDFEDGSLDLVYIDAAHDYNSVKQDILTWLPKIKKGGFIAGHDYRYDPNIGVYEAVNDIFVNDYKINSFPDSSFIIKL